MLSAGCHFAQYYPLPREKAPNDEFPGRNRARMGAGVADPLHQGLGRAFQEGVPAGGSQERERAEDLHRQLVPDRADQAERADPLRRRESGEDEAGCRRRQ